MKWLILAYLIFFPLSSFAQVDISGEWEFYKKIYMGEEMPHSPDDPMHLQFAYTNSGESRIWWWNDFVEDHCNRKGVYEIDGNFIVDKVIWVDPTNSVSCSSDPDMQLGKITKTPFELKNGDLYLEFNLSDEKLYYVLRKKN